LAPLAGKAAGARDRGRARALSPVGGTTLGRRGVAERRRVDRWAGRGL